MTDHDTPEDLLRAAYRDAYDRPITLTASGGVHADSMPRVRQMAGNEDGGMGTYTSPTTIDFDDGPTISSRHLLDDVATAMIRGTRDSIGGRDPDDDRAL